MCLLLYSRRVQQQKNLVKHAEGLMNISYQRKNGNWLEQFVHWAVDRLGTGQEIN